MNVLRAAIAVGITFLIVGLGALIGTSTLASTIAVAVISAIVVGGFVAYLSRWFGEDGP